MTIRNRTRARYESQTADAQARRKDTNIYEFDNCKVCGGVIVIWNGKRGQCAICEYKHDQEAEQQTAPMTPRRYMEETKTNLNIRMPKADKYIVTSDWLKRRCHSVDNLKSLTDCVEVID